VIGGGTRLRRGFHCNLLERTRGRMGRALAWRGVTSARVFRSCSRRCGGRVEWFGLHAICGMGGWRCSLQAHSPPPSQTFSNRKPQAPVPILPRLLIFAHMMPCLQRSLDVRPKASVEIPFMFTPAGLTRHACFLHVRSITTSRYQVGPSKRIGNGKGVSFPEKER
jgi:hypothetical protein